jgi:hypothetical protein
MSVNNQTKYMFKELNENKFKIIHYKVILPNMDGNYTGGLFRLTGELSSVVATFRDGKFRSIKDQKFNEKFTEEFTNKDEEYRLSGKDEECRLALERKDEECRLALERKDEEKDNLENYIHNLLEKHVKQEEEYQLILERKDEEIEKEKYELERKDEECKFYKMCIAENQKKYRLEYRLVMEEKNENCNAFLKRHYKKKDEECRTSLSEKDEECRTSLSEKDEECRTSLSEKDEECRTSLSEKDEECRTSLAESLAKELNHKVLNKQEEMFTSFLTELQNISEKQKEYIDNPYYYQDIIEEEVIEEVIEKDVALFLNKARGPCKKIYNEMCNNNEIISRIKLQHCNYFSKLLLFLKNGKIMIIINPSCDDYRSDSTYEIIELGIKIPKFFIKIMKIIPWERFQDGNSDISVIKKLIEDIKTNPELYK